jgi:hypothetical protein
MKGTDCFVRAFFWLRLEKSLFFGLPGSGLIYCVHGYPRVFSTSDWRGRLGGFGKWFCFVGVAGFGVV